MYVRNKITYSLFMQEPNLILICLQYHVMQISEKVIYSVSECITAQYARVYSFLRYGIVLWGGSVKLLKAQKCTVREMKIPSNKACCKQFF